MSATFREIRFKWAAQSFRAGRHVAPMRVRHCEICGARVRLIDRVCGACAAEGQADLRVIRSRMGAV